MKDQMTPTSGTPLYRQPFRVLVVAATLFGLFGLVLPASHAAAQASRCAGKKVTVVIADGHAPTEGNDVILGTDGDDIINALGGNDIVCGLDGDDSIFGGEGNDKLLGGRGRDILTGSLGDDRLVGGRGRDLLIDGPGSDSLAGGGGGDWCTGRDEHIVSCEELYDGAADEGLPPTWRVPLKSTTLGSKYGPRLHPILGTVRMHNGVDLSGDTGDRILAAGPGTVVASGVSGGFGKRVIIDHGNGWSTLYAHMSKLRVDEGDVVEMGDGIGKLGSTGLSTGPHLHFETRLGNIRLDPQLFINFD